MSEKQGLISEESADSTKVDQVSQPAQHVSNSESMCSMDIDNNTSSLSALIQQYDFEDPFTWEKRTCCQRTGFWIKILYILFVKSFLLMFGYWIRHINHPRKAYERFTYHMLFKAFDVKHIKIGPAVEELNNFRGVVMTTHKSYLDFTNAPMFGYCSALGRAGPAFILPAGSCFTCCTHSYLVFCRGAHHDWDKFGKKIANFITGKRPRLMVYPEGHRNREGRGCQRLRTGIFRICFDQKVPVFLAPSEGAQYCLNEFTCVMKKGMPVVVNYLGKVDPTDFSDWQSFYDECEGRFRQGYNSAVRYYDTLVGHKDSLREQLDNTEPNAE